jgi:hypothetical protein
MLGADWGSENERERKGGTHQLGNKILHCSSLLLKHDADKRGTDKGIANKAHYLVPLGPVREA